MDHVKLGRTDLSVSRLALGGLFVSMAGGPFERALAAVRRAAERGVNYIDTAPMYLDSEAVLGRILPEVPQPIVLSTKLGARPQPFDARDAKALRESFETSCQLLGRETIDILMIHEPDRVRQFDWWEDFDSATGPVMEVIDTLKAEGRIRYAGLGGTTAYDMARLIRTGRFDVVLTAFNTSLLWREAWHEVLPAAAEHNVGVVAGSPLQQGALARLWQRRDRDRYLAVKTASGTVPCALCAGRSAAASRFPRSPSASCFQEPRIHTVLMGARSVEEVDANADAVERGPLAADLLAELDAIAAMVPFRPHDEPFALPFGRPYAGTPAAGPV